MRTARGAAAGWVSREVALEGGRKKEGRNAESRSPGLGPPLWKSSGAEGSSNLPQNHSADPRDSVSKCRPTPAPADFSPGEGSPARPSQLGRRFPPAVATAAAFPSPPPPAPAHLHTVEPGLQPELLNHLLHSGDTGGTRHGARKEGRFVGGGSAGPDGGEAKSEAGLGTLSLSFRFFARRIHARRACASSARAVSAPHPCGAPAGG